MSKGLAIALAIVVASGASLAHAQDYPPYGAWLRYTYDERVHDGTGEYEGYEDRTVARARYDVVSLPGETPRITGHYTWTYTSPERRESQTVERTVEFSLTDRRYLGPQTDSSDYDDRDARTLATWIWIPPGLAVGDRVPILDQTFTVESLEAPIRIAGAMRSAIRLAASYQGVRDDDYGRFETTTSDLYWFDRATGMFLREEVDERDVGTYEGLPASFRVSTVIEVIDASYAPSAVPVTEAPPPPPDYHRPPRADRDSTGFSPVWLAAAVVVGVILLVLWIARQIPGANPLAGRPTMMADGTRFTVERVTDAASLALPSSLSPTYQPFLQHFADVALRAGNPVAIAKAQDGRIVGFGTGDLETAIGSVFAPDSDVCEALRKTLGVSEFFSEVRHPRLTSVARAKLASSEHAYNVYETYEVLSTSSRPEDLGYDREVVSRMTAQDLPKAAALATAVYRVPCEKWLRASFDAGDLAWVARSEGEIVGLAMASLCGTSAHLHGLTVLESARGRGLGTALMRARLRALFDLGATTIVSECATWNLAAREVAARHGLARIGEVYVESSDTAREARPIVRR